MISVFWAGVNITGFIILCFIYYNTGKQGAKQFLDLKLFRYLQVAVMLHLIFDTVGYLLIEEQFFVTR
ncbi:MAG: hypothetical protein FWD40_04400 [Treponema sp.]|nr:hypothetical protein [Treponema sp.]